MDFLIIPEETSKSNKIELLILNENGNGVVHIEQKIKEENFQLTITEEKTTEVIGVDLILKGRLQPFILNNLNQREKNVKKFQMDLIIFAPYQFLQVEIKLLFIIKN